MNMRKLISGLEVTGIYVVVLIMMAIVILPLLFTVGSSLTQGTSMLSSRMFPANPTLDHYKWLFTDPESYYLIWYKNSLIVGAFTCLFAVAITTLTAYAFSRYRFVGRRYGLYTFLLLQMFPSLMAMVAIYVLLMVVGLIDSLAGLIIVYVGGQIPVNTWLVKGYFNTISRELDDAARCDGAGHLRVFFKILLPLAKPILVVVALGSLMAPFMDFVLPKIILRDINNYTIAVGLFQFINSAFAQFTNNFTRFAAGSVLIALPISMVFLFLQRYFIAGLTSGATKG